MFKIEGKKEKVKVEYVCEHIFNAEKCIKCGAKEVIEEVVEEVKKGKPRK